MELQSSFLPRFSGCVEKDRRMARAVERLYREELESVAFYLYSSLLAEDTDPTLSVLFDSLAVEKARHFKILGNLLHALGGDPSLCLQTRTTYASFVRTEDPDKKKQSLLYESLEEERRVASFYSALLAHTEDGVVRSVLSCLMEEERGHEEKLTAFFG